MVKNLLKKTGIGLAAICIMSSFGLKQDISFGGVEKILIPEVNAKTELVKYYPVPKDMNAIRYEEEGSINLNNGIKKIGAEVKLPTTIPTKEGYTFLAWKSSITGKLYKPGDAWTEDENAIFTALWEEDDDNKSSVSKKYTVTYHANGGEGAPASQVKYHSTDLTLSNQKPTKKGSTFDYWVDVSNPGNRYNPGATYSENSNLNLTAVWTPLNGASEDDIYYYTITYSKGNVEGEVTGLPGYQLKPSYASINLSSSIPVCEGYKFTGWKAHNTGGIYQPGYRYAINQSCVMVAQWQREQENKEDLKDEKGKQYKISYSTGMEKTDFAMLVKGMPATQVKDHGIDIQLSSSIPACPNSVFCGWSASTGGTYNPGDIYDINDYCTMTAIWDYTPISNEKPAPEKEITYKITFGNTEGSYGADPIEGIAYGEVVNLPGLASVDSTKRKFIGWSTANDRNTILTSVTVKNSMTLYANWEYYVTVQASDGDKYDQSGWYKDGSTCTVSGWQSGKYVVDYWVINGLKHNGNTASFVVEGPTTAIAYWAKGNLITVKLNTNGGSLPSGTKTEYTITTDETLALPTPTKANYEFAGWTYGSTNYGTSFKGSDNITLTAKWEAKKYTIKFNSNGGSYVAPVTAKYGTTINLPTPTKTGYIFKGWGVGGSKYTITGNKTFIASWQKSLRGEALLN